jgi:hypothetical protein
MEEENGKKEKELYFDHDGNIMPKGANKYEDN